MEVIEQLGRQGVPHDDRADGSWAAGRVRRRDVSKETIYCAELVAATYPAHGHPATSRPPGLV